MTGKIILISIAAALSSSPLPEQCTWHGSGGEKMPPLLDAEAVRVVSSSPDWTPSRDLAGDGRSSTFTMSVSFRTE